MAKVSVVQSGNSSLDAYAGGIRRDAIYRLDEVKERMGWREAAFRAACRRGLKVHHVGKRTYVTGEDLFAYITMGGSHE